MPIAKFQMDDGRIARFEVPEGTTPEQAQSMMQEHFSAATPEQTATQPKPSVSSDALVGLGAGLGSGVGKVALGAQHYLGKGLGGIGAEQIGKWLVEDAASGRKKLESEVSPYKEVSPVMTGGGEIAGEIAATLPVGGLIAKPLMAGAKYAPQLGKIASAIESGGFATNAPAATTALGKIGNAALRIGGGATTGAVTAGLIDPNDAGTGAIIGGAIPVVGKVAGTLGEKLGRSMTASPEVADLARRAAAQGIDIPADRLVNSPSLNAMAASLRYLPFSGRATAESKMEGQLQKALSRTFGQDTDNITKGLRDAQSQLGSKFDDTLKSTSVKVDDTFINDAIENLQKAKNELSEADFKIIDNQVNDILAKSKDGVIDGAAAYNIKKNLDRIGARNSNEAWYSNQLKKSLMGALNRSLGPEEAAKFATVRQQYGNMLDLEPLAKAGAEGDISIARLANMKNINNPQLQEVADIAAQFVKPRESQHGAMQRVVLGGLGAGAAGMGMAAPVIGGLTAGRLANTLLQSNLAKNAILSPQANTQALSEILRSPYLRSGAVAIGD